MDSSKNKFDLVFSLGGNCISALQLRQRGLRTCSLPFDWLFHIDDKLLSSISKCFREDFKNWLKIENMIELKGDERGTSPHFQYKDLYTGYRFIHDFHKPIENKKEYKRVKLKQDKRIKRLYELIGNSSDILILLNAKWNINVELVKEFHQMLIEKWPDKKIKIMIINFSQTADEKIQINDDCLLFQYSRSENSYDYFQTNYEWEFLDNIVLKEKYSRIKRIIDVKRIGHEWQIHLAKKCKNIFGFRICIFGIILDFCLGEKR